VKQEARLVLVVWLFLWMGACWGQAQQPVAPAMAERPIQITDSDGITPLPFAVVVNKRTLEAEASNDQGIIELPFRIVQDSMVVRSMGYVDLLLVPGDRVPDRLRMVNDMISLDAAEIVTENEVATVHAVALQSLTSRSTGMIPPLKRMEVASTAADLLWSTGSVLVQQSQQGGGSPVLRGFEANRVLLVVDGVRMNNAIYRSGHLQSSITIDPQVLSQTQVILGPNSVAYGSDALGGVIHYQTREPKVGTRDVSANASTAFRSPNSGWMGHVDFEINRQRLGSLTSITLSHFGDLRQGTRRRHGDAEWGLVSNYATRVNGVDTLLTNDDPAVQLKSGYDQLDLLQKVRFQTPWGGYLSINAQYSTSSDVPRYDMFDDRKNGLPKWAEWNYGPQERLMTSAVYKGFMHRWGIQTAMTASYQRIGEDRITRRFGSDTRYHQEETVDVWGLNLGGFRHRLIGTMSMGAGISATYNSVLSEAWSENLASGVVDFSEETRYPNGGSAMRTMGAYITVRQTIKTHLLSGGLRYSFAGLDCRYDSSRFVVLPFDRIESSEGAITGSISGKWKWSDAFMGLTTASSGFRHPNVDDVGKVFEKNGLVTIPNDSLRPEYVYSIEHGFTWNPGGMDLAQLTVTGFNSWWIDAILPTLSTLQGDSVIWYNGDSARVQTNVNASRAVIRGFRVEGRAKLFPKIQAEAALNWTYGWNQSAASPLGHIPPFFGRVSVVYQHRWLTFQAYSLFNGVKPIEEYSLDGEDNQDEALPSGTPAWYTLNAEASIQLQKGLQMRVGVRNALDEHYRVFSSGISGAGRGLYASLHASF
jgi:hemoglobin/transferrin/lactoferrin receptor protein